MKSLMVILPAMVALTAAGCASSAREGGQVSNAQLAMGDVDMLYARASDTERDRIICRREMLVGSNRPQRVCTTLRQRDEMRRGAEEANRRINQRQVVCTGGDGTCY